MIALIANHLWQSTLFAIAAGLLTLAFRSSRAPVRYGLWLAASVKFLIPFAALVAIGSQVGWHSPPAAARSPFSFVMEEVGQPFVSAAAPQSTAAQASGWVPQALAGVWLCGFAIGAVAWSRRWRRIRAALRSASPMTLDPPAPIPVMASPERLEPGVFGIRTPVLLLPEGIAAHLTPGQLQAVVAHELCHVRRRDNLTAAIQMLVETIFWFHPLVWWLRERLVEERERACDEEVLRSIAKPEVYAEGILNVCKFYMQSPLLCVSGVTGSNLKKRIEEIMTHRIADRLNLARKLLLTAAGVAAIAAPVIVGMLNAPQARAQSQSDARLAFEVASVKPTATADPRRMGWQVLPGGKLVTSNLSVLTMIAAAYHIPFQSARLTGGPEWAALETFDIEATAEKGAIPAGTSAEVRDQKIRLMLQALLADRFKLTLRREMREVPVYAIVVAKNGHKLKKSKIEEKDCEVGPDGGARAKSCHEISGGQGRGIHGEALDISDITVHVQNWTDRPVVDRTGIKGLWKVDTDGWIPLLAMGPNQGGNGEGVADPSRPTLFTVFEQQLGLKLEPTKAQVEFFVIDHVERPTAN
jgi:bla regulator protein BlaR1